MLRSTTTVVVSLMAAGDQEKNEVSNLVFFFLQKYTCISLTTFFAKLPIFYSLRHKMEDLTVAVTQNSTVEYERVRVCNFSSRVISSEYSAFQKSSSFFESSILE